MTLSYEEDGEQIPVKAGAELQYKAGGLLRGLSKLSCQISDIKIASDLFISPHICVREDASRLLLSTSSY